MVVGESASGKTTFIKNLLKKFQRFMSNSVMSSNNSNGGNINNDNKKNYIFSEFDEPLNVDKITSGKPTMTYQKYKVKCPNLQKFQNFTFNIIDSPGYGSSVNNEVWIKDINDYIKKSVKNIYY
jgi:septin family protein